MARPNTWSYLSGERGRNRVRVFEKRPGKFFAEWREGTCKKRVLLEGVGDATAAKQKADEMAVEFGRLEAERQAPITMDELMHTYLREASVSKGSSKQAHDRRAVRVWTAFFPAQPELARSGRRHPSSLDRLDWDRFVGWRRRGEIPGWPNAVGPRQTAYDLKFLISCLNWACGRKVGGKPLLETSPWRTEVRRAQKWGMPKERSPNRPGMSERVRLGLVTHAPHWQFTLALVLQRETRRRNSSIRRLSWSDVDLEAETVRWRGKFDKAGMDSMTPLTAVAAGALRNAPSWGIGDVPVFPSAKDPAAPTPRHTVQTWLRRAKRSWLRSVPETERTELASRLHGVGFHAEKRSGVRDAQFRALPPAIQEAWAGTRYETLRTVYDQITVEDIRAAMKKEMAGQGNRTATAMDTTSGHHAV